MGEEILMTEKKRPSRTKAKKIKIDLTPLLRRFMLQLLSQQEQITALRYAIQDNGLLDQQAMASAMNKSEARWLRHRQVLEGAEANTDAQIEQMLREFEGPIQ